MRQWMWRKESGGTFVAVVICLVAVSCVASRGVAGPPAPKARVRRGRVDYECTDDGKRIR